MMQFFRLICKVKEKQFKIQIQLHKNIANNKALNYWSKITEIPITNFRRPLYQQSKSSQNKRPKHTLPYGT